MNETKIQWHPGFVSAMNLELAQNRGDLVYEKEYNLNTKPLMVDLLVIKKDRDIQIANEIGKMFRGHNIMEYKSPEDHLNIDDFYKSQAYACLYKSYGETVDARTADDVTVSIAREARPMGLFQYFETHGIRMENPFPGIYYVPDAALFQTQVIVISELNPENHTWLKALSKGMSKQSMRELFQKVDALTQGQDRELADSVLEVSIRANRKTVEELRGDDNMCQALLEIMEPEINAIKKAAVQEAQQEGWQQGRQQGQQEGRQEGRIMGRQEGRQEGRIMGRQEGRQEGRIMGIVEVLRNLGKSTEEIKETLTNEYHLSEEDILSYL